MAKNDERSLNITINNKEDEDSEVIISINTIIKKLKKYFMVWVAAAIIAVAVSFGYALFTTHTKKAPLQSIVSFSYSGIERGLDPKGRQFRIETIKDPSVIKSALEELDMDIKYLEDIRRGISFTYIIPQNAYDKYTIYSSILEKGGSSSLTAGEKILETSDHPTKFIAYFDYNSTSLSDEDAVEVFNTILEKYEDYFYKEYGYNESLGNAVVAISYENYDYAEAVDVFDNSLRTLKRYVKQLADEDETRFRSEDTGYTFDDLYSAINTIQSINLDKISSYVTLNNVTKDKDKALAYYEYRIKTLTRQRDSYEEQLESLDASIEAYEKDQVIVFGGAEEANVQSSVSSAEYDKMFTRKNNISAELADVKQRINYYKERVQALKTGTSNSKEMTERVDADLADLDKTINNLVDLVKRTSDDYYKNVTFGHAYNILVPATNTSADKFARVIDNMKLPAVALEAVCFMIYACGAFLEAVINDSRKRKLLLEAEKSAGGNGDGGDDDDDDSKEENASEKKEESSEEKKSSSKKKKA